MAQPPGYPGQPGMPQPMAGNGYNAQPLYPPPGGAAPAGPPATAPYPSARPQYPGPGPGHAQYPGQAYPLPGGHYSAPPPQPVTGKIEPWTPCPGEKPLYDGPDMPAVDMPENQDLPEPEALPPDPSRLSKIPGYEGVRYHGGPATPSAPPIPPPPYDQATATPQEPEVNLNVQGLTEEQAREALVTHISQHCCYGKSAAKDMTISSIKPSSALHYVLDTFTECRTTSWDQEPYKGQPVDSAMYGPAPMPWMIQVQPPTMFQEQVQQMEVPHTASINHCHGCGAHGWLRCNSCLGRGHKRCIHCHGSGRDWKLDAHGHRHAHSCWHCHGTGRKRCPRCQGDGRIMCKTCQGYRQIKSYIKLTVAFKTHSVDHVLEKTDMPNKLVKSVGGVDLLDQTLPLVWPIMNFPVTEICQVSQSLVNGERAKHQQSRILMQRQRLKAVQVSECAFTFKNKTGRFWVYGNECKVYTKEYPQTCCWGCNIL